MIERVGRRGFLMVSCTGMGVCSFLMAVCYHWDLALAFKVAAIMGYIISFALGVGPLPWLLGSEIFPSQIRSMAMALSTVVNWACSFLVTLFFDDMTMAMGQAGLFVFYGAICILGTGFVFTMVPETRGKTLEEIEELFS